VGQIEANTGYGRVHAASGWVIEAWVGNGGASPPLHTAHRFGALNSTNIATFNSVCATAYNSGESAWLIACGSAFQTWYNGLSSAHQALVFEAARAAGEHGWGP